MKFSKKSRYGLRALVDLSLRSKKEYVTLSSIAERNGISQQYLEHIFATLRRSNIIKSVKGPQGGYSLNRPSKDIKISEVIRVLEGDFYLEAELSEESLSQDKLGLTIQTLIIDRLNKQVEEILEDITLEDLEKDYISNCQDLLGMYYI